MPRILGDLGRPVVLLIVAAAAVAFWLAGRGDGDPSEKAPATSTAAAPSTGEVVTVLRVVDGDTVVVRPASGAGEAGIRVRYIGIDSPESVKPDTPVQCYGEQASALNEELVDGKQVRLVLGEDPRDDYGRTLAYVYRASDGLFVNAELLRRGAARTLEISPNTRFADRFASLAAEARKAGRGLWSAC